LAMRLGHPEMELVQWGRAGEQLLLVTLGDLGGTLGSLAFGVSPRKSIAQCAHDLG
jgi:hypothetical protein